MESIFSEEQLTKVCGNLIYNIRKQKHKSAVVIAELIGISQQYLSEIELGTRRVSASMMSDICSCLNVAFNSDTYLIDEADNLFKKILRCIADFNQTGLSDTLNSLLSLKFKHSYAYSYYQCAQKIYEFYIQKAASIEPISLRRLEVNQLLKSFVHYFNSLITDDLSEADAGITLVDLEPHQSEIITTLLLNQKAYLLEKKHDYESALSILEKSKIISHSQYLVSGTLAIEMNIASLYSRLGRYEKSNAIYSRIIDITAELEIPTIHNASLFNIAYNKMISGRYEDCICYINELMTKFHIIPKKYSAIYYLLAYSHFMIGKKNEALLYCSEALSNLSEEEFPYKIAYLINLCATNKIDSNETSIAIDYFNATIQNGDLGDVIIIYNLLSKTLKFNNDIVSALNCSEKFSSYLASKIQ